MRCRRPRSSSRSIARTLTSSSRSCCRPTTPCWRAATSLTSHQTDRTFPPTVGGKCGHPVFSPPTDRTFAPVVWGKYGHPPGRRPDGARGAAALRVAGYFEEGLVALDVALVARALFGVLLRALQGVSGLLQA